ncbi:BON domain-containing protein [Vibrio sp. SCSIO 43135]|uniref:BON domain-containing protein n=1 Tax=Vibrio paucivorans TaxID=2829489 RepID=A0A9X3CBM2_9VIBR|nr:MULTISPECIES: BON domain-containing protein [Vibrio]MCW8332701.1 BON domain-containing protein [Vibrio paucivorans]USD41619.1 BON domain-containing protein [Vibrio sp. SCSIO 43135]
MKILKLSSLLLIFITLAGCAGSSAENTASDPRSMNQIWSDNNIDFEVAGLSNKPPYRGNVSITASSFEGTVILMGQSRTQELLTEFETQARKVKGVKTIHNQVRIKAPLSVGNVSQDSWITTKVKSALLTKSELSGANVKVITEDGEVFLLGYVSQEHAEIATEVARNVSGVKKVVRAFQYSN